MNLVLTPVVEFCPSNYRTSDHPSPKASSVDNPEAWDTYWRTCLKDAGIVDLKPFETASQLVPVHRLVDEHVLDALLRTELADLDEWHADFLGPLEGGYVVSVSETHLKPGCCGSLSNLQEWRHAAEHPSEDWAMVWTGHPWTHVSAKVNTLTILHPLGGRSTRRPKGVLSRVTRSPEDRHRRSWREREGVRRATPAKGRGYEPDDAGG